MKSIIERAMEIEFDVKVDAVQFSKMSEENQALMINSMTKKEQYENLNNLQLVDEDVNGLIVWKQGK